MERENDHTCEVEKRVTAIPIKARDRCGFYQRRESALLPTRECRNCVFAKFEAQADHLNPDGFCKFKK